MMKSTFQVIRVNLDNNYGQTGAIAYQLALPPNSKINPSFLFPCSNRSNQPA